MKRQEDPTDRPLKTGKQADGGGLWYQPDQGGGMGGSVAYCFQPAVPGQVNLINGAQGERIRTGAWKTCRKKS